MKKICVYTCITGDYDNLHEITKPEKSVDYYCFTNNKNLKSNTWKIIQIKDDNLDNCRLARKIKILGHPKINNTYDIAVWTDASVNWQRPISDFVKTYFKDTSFAICKHSSRNSVYDEAAACLIFQKETKKELLKTIDFLKKAGFPDGLGLHESTIFIKKPADPKVTKMCETWFNVVKNYSRRDQLSFDYAVWHSNLKIKTIKLNIWQNPWFTHSRHNTSDNLSHFYIYYGNPFNKFNFNNFHSLKFTKKGNTFSFSHCISKNTSELYLILSDTPGTLYGNINVNLPVKKIHFINSISYSGNNIFHGTHGAIKIFGEFKKNQTLNFSINLQILNRDDLVKLFSKLYLECLDLASKFEDKSKQLNSLEQEYAKQTKTLADILNSKTWKLSRRIRNLLPPYTK